jgi:hypothetical protein
VVPRRLALTLLAALAAGCAGPARSVREGLERSDLQARLAARAAAMLGEGRERFAVGREAFNPDCSGFVEAVYAAEGISLRRVLQAAAPRETSAVAAAWEAAGRFGERWRGGEWPAPGDLVFFDDTWDRNGNGRRDDPLTHVGIVEQVASGTGTVTFLHRAGRAVERGFMTLDQPDRWRAADGTVLNTPLRTKGKGPRPDVPVLAGELFGGYGHLDPRRLLEEAGVR